MTTKKILIFFCLLLTPSFSYSQNKVTLEQDLKVSEQLITAGRASDAIKMLEKLSQAHPENQQVFSLLSRAYSDAKSYAPLEILLKSWMEKNPEDWIVWIMLGDLYLKTGEKSSAEKSFEKALLIAPDSAGSYQLIAATYLGNEEYEKAIRTYKSGIKKLGNKPLLLQGLIELYEITGDYALAVETYFAWAKEDSSKYREAERKTMQLIESGIKTDELEKGLEKIARLEPKKSMGYKLHGDLLLKKGEPERAFQLYKTADLLSGSEGKHLLLFAQHCIKKGFYQLSLETSQYLETYCQSIECAIKAKFLTASSLQGLKKYDQALNTFQQIALDYPVREIQSQAYFQIGNLNLENLKYPDEALTWYRKILPLKETTSYPLALIKIGQVYLLKNQLDSALSFYQESLKDPLAQPVVEELYFCLAEIYFYQGELEKASETYQQIIKDYPRGMFINNSLIRLNLIKNNLKMNRPFLKDFSKALLLLYQDDLTGTEKLLEKIVQANIPDLSEAALMEKSNLLRLRKEFKASISEYKVLMERFPQSLYLPLALKSIGDIHLENLKEVQEAKNSYDLFLKKFPNSLYSQEVREKMKLLLTDNQVKKP
ncbi:MAG: tetratricopeptide repeat protein [candidate division Zixibacteria bacterium]|nr:tetratricopeptide repeat protein [candidate division Zixibacteria bacterium]